jgi:hypothetical protein
MAWKPSYDNYKSTDVTLRIMNIYDFVNSKTLFRTMRWGGVARGWRAARL